jgi:Family of unknown function (DUF6677)
MKNSGNPDRTARSAALKVVAAWLVPGLGHLLLGRRSRAALFAAVVFTAVVIGVQLDGKLCWFASGEPLTNLCTVASMGMGIAYFVLHFQLRYTGEVLALGYEYGFAFLLTAGLMNLLLVIDVWDIARGRKE